MEYNLELTEDQSQALSRCVSAKGHATVRTYISKVENDKRTQRIYDIVKEKTKSIADAVLSSIGHEINRGAIINAVAVQANAKSEDFDEILLRKTKSSGDITIPTNCILISTNCVSVIKSSCERQTTEQERDSKGKEEENYIEDERGKI
jgi:flagellar biosynthesis/type III secretory pathway M-ring protein FliF/YscJ